MNFYVWTVDSQASLCSQSLFTSIVISDIDYSSAPTQLPFTRTLYLHNACCDDRYAHLTPPAACAGISGNLCIFRARILNSSNSQRRKSDCRYLRPPEGTLTGVIGKSETFYFRCNACYHILLRSSRRQYSLTLHIFLSLSYTHELLFLQTHVYNCNTRFHVA